MIRIGAYTNIQDNTIITEALPKEDEDHDGSVVIGNCVTIGHSCLIKGATVESYSLIGMKTILDERSYVESEAIVAAGSVVPKGFRIPSRQIWGGNPVKYIRELSEEELEFIRKSAENYKKNAALHNDQFFLPFGTQWKEAEALGFGDIIGYRKIDF